ncbi:Hypothetical predicted protein [Xyrichtys novacula]|uniref:Uncharacterized protein n=1 Tax=Xyrichtys novacula TaxID=13765 RepID=A0AAV1HG48_XYRNO|nr:Hypothetical predicted protein [Xyrichtys novacula]
MLLRGKCGKTVKTRGTHENQQQIAAAAMEGSQSVLTHRLQFRWTGTCLLGGDIE